MRKILRGMVAVVTVLLVCGGVEIATRCYAYFKYGTPYAYHWDLLRPHPYLCYEAYPNHEGMIEGRGGFRTNSLGFRSPEIPQAKAPGTFRIAFFGGSTTFGSNISENKKTYPALVGNLLQEHYPARTIEIMNCGLHAYTSWEMLLTYLVKAVPYQPDLVVLYEGFNDTLCEIYPDYTYDFAAFRRSWVKSEALGSRLARQSAFLNIVNMKLTGGAFGRMSSVGAPPDEAGQLANLQQHDALAFRHNIKHLIVLAQHNGSKVLLITQAFATSQITAPRRAGMDLHNAITRELAGQYQTYLFDFATAFQNQDALFQDPIHLTAPGVAQQAGAVAEFIIQAALLAD